ncbi:hypothetical protein YC2023_087813 [Brassica napus]
MIHWMDFLLHGNFDLDRLTKRQLGGPTKLYSCVTFWVEEEEDGGGSDGRLDGTNGEGVTGIEGRAGRTLPSLIIFSISYRCETFSVSMPMFSFTGEDKLI